MNNATMCGYSRMPVKQTNSGDKVTMPAEGVALISHCQFTRSGLTFLGKATGQRVQVMRRMSDVIRPRKVPFRLVICHPCGDLAQMMRAIVLLVHCLLAGQAGVPVVILSRSRCSWLYGTLLRHIRDRTLLRVVERIDPGTSLSGLMAMVQGDLQVSSGTLTGDPRAAGLSREEMVAVMALLKGEKMTEMASRTGLSVSVLYARRLRGLRKLGVVRQEGV